MRQWLKLPNGTPSDDTFRGVFTALAPDAFCDCFIEFTAALSRRPGRELVAIDGKTQARLHLNRHAQKIPQTQHFKMRWLWWVP